MCVCTCVLTHTETHIILPHGGTRWSNDGCLCLRKAENMVVFSDQEAEQLTVLVQSFRPRRSLVKGWRGWKPMLAVTPEGKKACTCVDAAFLQVPSIRLSACWVVALAFRVGPSTLSSLSRLSVLFGNATCPPQDTQVCCFINPR